MKKSTFNKNRIISIVVFLTMLMSFGGDISIFSSENPDVVTSDIGEIPLESYFLKPLSSPLPKVTDGFMTEPEKDMPKADGGFIEPIDNPYTGDEYKFISEPADEMPKVKDSGFIKDVKNQKAKPSKGNFIDEITPADKEAKVIKTPEELASVTGGNYVLGCDIYLDEYNGGVWTPVEIRQDLTFDGQGHIIYNLNTDKYDAPGGLFSEFHGENLTVKNLGFSYTKECYVESGTLFSGFVGGSVEIENCFNEMNVTGDWYGGGLLSMVSSSDADLFISSSYNRGTVSSSEDCGGIVGNISLNATVNIYDCFNFGAVKGKYAGGIVGSVGEATIYESGLNIDIRRCENSAKITAESSGNEASGGGIAGMFKDYTSSTGINYQIIHCKNTATVSAKAKETVYAGGIVGLGGGRNSEFYNCSNQGGISTSKASGGSSNSVEYAGGIVAHSRFSVFFDSCFNKGRVVANNYAGGLCSVLKGGDITHSINSGVILSKSGQAAGLVAEAEVNFGSVLASYNTGKITGASYPAGLVSIWTTNEYYTGGEYTGYAANLMSTGVVKDCFNTGDIVYTGEYGYTMECDMLTGGAGILSFGKTIVENCYNEGKISYGAGIAGEVLEVDRCANYGVISSGNGIVQGVEYLENEPFGVKISNCFNNGDITDGTGICRMAEEIKNCYNAGNITQTDNDLPFVFRGVFGIAEVCSGKVENCYNTGSISGTEYASAVAYLIEGSMTDCFNVGTISGDYCASGLAMRVLGDVKYCYNTAMVEAKGNIYTSDGSYANPLGGVVGTVEGVMTNCYNTGDFLYGGKSTCYGGLAGKVGGIENCYNTGRVFNNTNVLRSGSVGGICGKIIEGSKNAQIKNCYNSGEVYMADFQSTASGICSAGAGYVENCINTGKVTGGEVHGISGRNYDADELYISNCVNTGTLVVVYGFTTSHGTKYCRGTSSGIGEATSISDCINTSDVADSGIGVATSTITNCVNFGNVSKNAEFVERHSNDTKYTPGFGIGAAGKEISHCINFGSVTGVPGYECYVDEYVAPAGIGVGDTIRNCINEGKVTSPDLAGGISSCANYVYDCKNTGSVSAVEAAGIVTAAKNIERCENLASVTASKWGGGISIDAESLADCKNSGGISGKHAGGISVCVQYSVVNCTNRGNVTAQIGGGGIVARCEKSSYDIDEDLGTGSMWKPEINSATFYGCKNYGNVSGNLASGIGDGVSHSGCENHGNISSNEESVGIGRGRMYGCVNTGDVTVYGTSGNAIASGICSPSYWRSMVVISDCKNSGEITADGADTTYATGIFSSTGYGEDAYVTNSQNTGIISAHSRHMNEEWPVGVYAGGVGGEVGDEHMLYIDDLSGSTTSPSATIDTKKTGDEGHDSNIGDEYVYSSKILAHGAAYKEEKEILPESVSISGPEIIEKDEEVMFSSEVLPEDAQNKGLVWSSDNPTVASVSWDGTVRGVSKGTATITAKTYNGVSASREVLVQENAIYVTVMGFKRDKLGEFFPLEGASVRAGGMTKKTDKDGKTWFERSDLPDAPLAPIHIEAGKDYVERDESINLVANTLGQKSYTYYLAERDDKIYIKSAVLTKDNDKYDLMYNPGMVHIPLLKDGEINKTAYHIDVEVDWGKYEENTGDRKLRIEGEQSRNTYAIYEKGDWISFATFFDEGEPLRLVATTKNEDGEEVKTEKVLPLDIKLLDTKLLVESTDNLPIDNIYFLDKLGLKMNLGDIGCFADEIKYENGILKVVYKLNVKKDEAAKKLGILSGDVGPRVDITGKFEIPLLWREDSEWSGAIGIKARGHGGKMGYDSYTETESKTIKIFGHEHNFFIGNVPCYIDVEFGAGVEGSLGIGGTYDDLFFEGKIGGYLEGSIGGGVGGSINDYVKLKFGPEGSLTVELPVVFSNREDAESPVSFEPALEGRIDALLEIEFFDVWETAPKVELGRYTWNRHDGGKWEHLLDRFDKTITLQTAGEGFDLKNTRLNPKGREYLKNGGGFGNEEFSLMSAGGQRFKKIYSNILSSADAQTVLVNGNKRILFTTDDPERNSYNVMSLVYTDYIDGQWTEPKEVDNDETIDANASAEENFVVWENTKSAMKSDMTIGDFLKNTDIKAAVADAEGYVVTKLSDDDTYDFCPKVSAKDGKAFVAWLSNSEADIICSEGTTSLNYSFYDGEWSEVVKIEDIGQVTNINVLFDGTHGKIIYKKDSELYCVSTKDGICTKVFDHVGRYAVTEKNSKLLCASFDSEQNLVLMDETGVLHTVETFYNKYENPVIISDGDIVRVFWTEKDGIYYVSNLSGEWSGRLCYGKDFSFAGGISGVISENSPELTFFAKENGITDLIHMTQQGEDELFLEEVRVESTDDGQRLVARVYNNSEKLLENVSLKATRKGEDVEVEGENVTIAPGCDGEIVAIPDYSNSHEATKLRVQAVCNDIVTEGQDVIYTQGDVSISQSFFTVDEAGDEFLNIYVTNSGSAKIPSTEVKVHENSEDSSPIYSFTVGELLPGETSQVRIEHKQDPDVVYYIRVSAEADTDEYNNFDLIAYDRVVESDEEPDEIIYDSQSGELRVKIPGDRLQSESGTIVVAMYDDKNKLSYITSDTFEIADGFLEKTFDLDVSSSDYTIKVMTIKDLESMKPLGKVYDIKCK